MIMAIFGALVLIVTAVWIWYLRHTYLESREESFRRHLELHGYSSTEIDAAVRGFLKCEKY